MSEPEPLAVVAGKNAKRLRIASGATLDDLAKAARMAGLRWSTGKVGDFESGRVSPTLPTLFALLIALGEVTNAPVAFPDLVDNVGPIRINDTLVVGSSALASALAGEPVELTLGDLPEELESFVAAMSAASKRHRDRELPPRLRDLPPGRVNRVRRDSGITEIRVATDLGIDDDYLARQSLLLWGSSFSAERDRRAGSNANAQTKGQASRTLKDELRASLRGND